MDICAKFTFEMLYFLHSQIRTLLEDDPEAHSELLEIIRKFRDEELGHLDTGLENNALDVSKVQLQILFVRHF